jgi:hypothetical protein
MKGREASFECPRVRFDIEPSKQRKRVFVHLDDPVSMAGEVPPSLFGLDAATFSGAIMAEGRIYR